VPSLNDLVRAHTALGAEDLEWLHLLVADWQLLADLSFADLVLWLPTRDRAAYVAVAQMRPTTGPTVHHSDLVGELLPRGRRPQVDDALDRRRICRERDPEWHDAVPVREETIPVVRGSAVLGVVARHTNLAAARTPSRLELTYLRTADDLAQMVAEGRFPMSGADVGLAAAPRVGDGLVRLDRDGVVAYASPNAMSAYRRLGLAADLLGRPLGEVTTELAPSRAPVDEALPTALRGRAARVVEVDGAGTVLQLRVIPLLPGGEAAGAVVLVRDVTEVRRRERELLSKDATIREIHHRVKNNLQTVAALLRLQSRRLPDDAARAALAEAVRRVATIALVHDTLSRGDGEGLGDAVDVDDVVDRLLAMVAEVAGDSGSARLRREGSVGRLGSHVATPLALALTELLQNALEHGLSGEPGSVVVSMTRTGRTDGAAGLRVCVRDDGWGLPDGFGLADSANLGLQIVRNLVTGELGGSLSLRAVQPRGTEAILELPVVP
jgi:two-component sensor histidine kinase/PAS domain-containing protein